ncbi:hypothetical protein, partial [Citreimonas salinaria]|uniref:hypothetical protein n=1 Tax=Citreimonas salinaria TaxID=321339 RepID=UPI001C42E900
PALRAEDALATRLHRSSNRNCLSVRRNGGKTTVGHANNDDIGLSVYASRGNLNGMIRKTFEDLYSELGGNLQSDIHVEPRIPTET